MLSVNKFRYLLSGFVILISVAMVQAQSTGSDVTNSLSRVVSKIHIPRANTIPAEGLRGLVKNMNARVPMNSAVASWWLESSQDTTFALFPGSKTLVNQTFYAYNTNDDHTKVLYKTYNDTTSMFENSSLDQYEYDSNFNVTKDLTSLWDKGTKSFQEQSQTIYAYNSSNLETERYSQHMLSGSWVNDNRTATTYDSQDRDTEVLNQNWGMSDWVNYDRTTYTYAQGVFPTMELYQTWDGSNWVDEERYVYTLNGDNNIETETYQVPNNGQWADSAKYTYTYDSNMRISQILEQYQKGGNWVDSTRTTITYHSSTGMFDFASVLVEARDGSNWINQYQTVYSYNSNNQVTEYLYQEWDGSQWVGIYRSVSTFDSNGNEVKMNTQYWFGTSWVDFVSVTNTYTQTRPTDVSTPIDKPVASTPTRFELLQNYPNPFNPSTVIQYKLAKTGNVRLTVYDLTGRHVSTLVNQAQGAGVYVVRFNASQLASGIYFYRLQTDGFSQIRKMLLIR